MAGWRQGSSHRQREAAVGTEARQAVLLAGGGVARRLRGMLHVLLRHVRQGPAGQTKRWRLAWIVPVAVVCSSRITAVARWHLSA